jgi:DNA-binding MurR/RpiR family transcriptional regulator
MTGARCSDSEVAVFSTKLRSMYPKFTTAEKKIADYLLVNRGDVGDLSSHELAECLGVGQSTVIRFSKKLGYRMFGDFMSDVRHADKDSPAEIGEADAAPEILEKLSSQYRDCIDTVVRHNYGDEFEHGARLIDGAMTVVCFGYLNSHVFAQYLSDSLVELGKCALCELEVVQAKRRIQRLDPERDVVVVISKSGEKAEPISVAAYAAACGVKVIAVSDSAETSLSRIADVRLNVIEVSDRSTPAVSMGTFAGVLLALDTLVMCVFQQNRKWYQRQYGMSLVTAFSERR